MTRRVVALLAALALLTSCTNSKSAPPPTTRPPLRPVGPSTTVADTLVSSPGSIVAEPIPLEPTRFGAGEQTMDCTAGDAQVLPLNPGDRTIMNVIDLPVDRALQTSRELTNAGQSVLFAKNGLLVHPGVAFDLSVTNEFRGLVGIGWGDAAQPVSIVHVPACQIAADPSVSLIYPGGFFALHPICATIRIIEFDEISDVGIGIGTPCPGQPPIEGPTVT